MKVRASTVASVTSTDAAPKLSALAGVVWNKTMPIVNVLPLSLPSLLINYAMTDGLTLTEPGAGQMAVAAINAAVYLGIGLFVFGRLEKKARLSGSLAQY